MPHSHTYPANQQPDQNPVPAPPHRRRRTNIAPQNRAARSLESWLLSDLGRLSMTTTTAAATAPNPTNPTRPPNHGNTRPKTPPRTYYTHTHYTSSSPLCEHSCSSSLASESSFPRSRGRTPSTSSSGSSNSSSSVREGAEDGDVLPTYRSAMELQGRENEALKPFGYGPREVVQMLREVESGSDDGFERERERGGRRKGFWR